MLPISAGKREGKEGRGREENQAWMKARVSLFGVKAERLHKRVSHQGG